jgi:protein SCO1/2
MKKKNLSKVIIVLVILLFPSLLYVIFATGKHHIDQMEYYGPVTTDSVLYKVPNAEFINHLGDSLSIDELEGNIIVYNFFCLQCSDSSARNALLVKAITERFFDKKDIKYISINLTPSVWGMKEVEEYSNPFNIEEDQWFFVTADSNYLADFVHNGLLVNSEYDEIKKPYAPGMATIVIVDKGNHIRGFLDGNQYVDQSTIIDVIKRIRLEEYQKASKKREDYFERRR